jgi:hypothetical protein
MSQPGVLQYADEQPNDAVFGSVTDHPWIEGPSTLQAVTKGGFPFAWCNCLNEGALGSVLLAAGAANNPQEGQPQTAAGAAFVHKYKDDDVWYPSNGVCLPVRKGGYYQSVVTTKLSIVEGRFGFTPTTLQLGDWEVLPAGHFTPTTDGFLFVSVAAEQEGYRGGVGVYDEVNQVILAKASVHLYEAKNEHISRECLCIPLSSGKKVTTLVEGKGPVLGPLRVLLYWMPILGRLWKLQDSVTVDIIPGRTSFTAPADGFLYGFLEAANPGDRGYLSVITGTATKPMAMASVHWYEPANRYVWCNSFMVPVRKGSYIIDKQDTCGRPHATGYFTSVEPA